MTDYDDEREVGYDEDDPFDLLDDQEWQRFVENEGEREVALEDE